MLIVFIITPYLSRIDLESLFNAGERTMAFSGPPDYLGRLAVPDSLTIGIHTYLGQFGPDRVSPMISEITNSEQAVSTNC